MENKQRSQEHLKELHVFLVQLDLIMLKRERKILKHVPTVLLGIGVVRLVQRLIVLVKLVYLVDMDRKKVQRRLIRVCLVKSEKRILKLVQINHLIVYLV